MQHFLSKQRAFEDNTLNTTQKGVFLWLWAGSQHNRHFFFAQITPQAHRGCLWVSGLSAAREEDWPALHHPCPVRLSVGGFALSTFYVFVKPLFLWSTSLWRRAACFQSSNSFMLRKQALTCSLRIKLLCLHFFKQTNQFQMGRALYCVHPITQASTRKFQELWSEREAWWHKFTSYVWMPNNLLALNKKTSLTIKKWVFVTVENHSHTAQCHVTWVGNVTISNNYIFLQKHV